MHQASGRSLLSENINSDRNLFDPPYCSSTRSLNMVNEIPRFPSHLQQSFAFGSSSWCETPYRYRPGLLRDLRLNLVTLYGYDTLLRHKGYDVYIYMGTPLNESLDIVRSERRRICKLYVRCCFSSHSPALPNVCGRFPHILLSFVLFTHDTHSNCDDWAINDASPYLDLTVVYGHNQDTQDTVP